MSLPEFYAGLKRRMNVFFFWFADRYQIIFKSASDNHLRIQSALQNPDGTYQVTLKFESYTDLKKYQKKMRRMTVSLSSAVAMVIVAIIVAPYVLNPSKSSANSFVWSQSNWGDVHSIDPDITTTTNKTSWTKFFTKDAGIATSASSVTLSATPASKTYSNNGDQPDNDASITTGNGGFNNGADFNAGNVALNPAGTTGQGVDASVQLGSSSVALTASTTDDTANISTLSQVGGKGGWATSGTYGQFTSNTTTNGQSLDASSVNLTSTQSNPPLGTFTSGTVLGSALSASGVATDSAGHVYVVDPTNKRIIKYNTDGSTVTSWSVSAYGTPSHVAVATSGNVYVSFANSTNNTGIRKFTSNNGANGNTYTYAIVFGDARFANNAPIVVDSAENVYLAGFAGNIIKYNSSGTSIVNFGTGVNPPDAIAVDSQGNVYAYGNIASFNNGIKKMTPVSGGVNAATYNAPVTIYSVNVGGVSNFGSDNGKGGLALDGSGNVYLGVDYNRCEATDSDPNSGDLYCSTLTSYQEIRKIQLSNGTVLATLGSSGTGANQFQSVNDVAIDPSGNIFAADNNLNRVLKWGATQTTYASSGTYTSYINGGTPVNYTWKDFAWNLCGGSACPTGASVSFKIVGTANTTKPADATFTASNCSVSAQNTASGSNVFSGACLTDLAAKQYLWYQATLTSSTDTLSTSSLDSVTASATQAGVFYAAGIYTSGVVDTGQKNAVWGNVSWNQTLNGGTIGILLSTSVDNVTWTNFKGNDGTDQTDCTGGKCYTTNAGQQINAIHNGARYIKYKAFLATPDNTKTPTINDITLNYSSYPTTFQKLISSPFNSSNGFNSVQKLTWTASNDTTGGTVQTQIRTAPNNGAAPDFTNSVWCGPTNCSSTTNSTTAFASDYYTDKTGVTDINAGQKDYSNDQWIQYATFLKSADGSLSPTISNVTTQYAYNVPPTIPNVGPTPLVQSTDGNGTITVPYTLQEVRDDFGNIPRGYAGNPIYVSLFYQPDGAITLGTDLPANLATGTQLTINNVPAGVPIPTAGTMLVCTSANNCELIDFNAGDGVNKVTVLKRQASFYNTDATFNSNLLAHSAVSNEKVYFMAKNLAGGSPYQSIANLTQSVPASPGANVDTTGLSFVWNSKAEPNMALSGNKLSNMNFVVLAHDGNPTGFNALGQSAPITAQILDLQPPIITSITTDATHTKTDLNVFYANSSATQIPLSVNFSKNITTTAPLKIDLSSTASCTTSGTVAGQNSVTCQYTNTGNTASGTYLKLVTPFVETSGTIKDQFGNALTSFTPASNLDAATNIVIDNVAPTADDLNSGNTKYAKASFSQSVSNVSDVSGSGIQGYQWSQTFGTGTVTFSAQTSATTNISLPTNGSADGSYGIQVRITDKAGNYTDKPMTLIWDATNPADAGKPSAPSITNNPNPTISWSQANDATSGLASYELQRKLGNGAWESVVTLTDNATLTASNPSYPEVTNLPDGSYTYQVITTDKTGNTSTSPTSDAMVVDTIAPTLSYFTSNDPLTINGSAISINNPIGGGNISISAVFDEVLGSNAHLDVKLGNMTADKIVSLSNDPGNNKALIGTFTNIQPKMGYDTTPYALSIANLVGGTESVSDIAGNVRTDSTIPSGGNLSDHRADLIIDTALPVLNGFTIEKAGIIQSSGTYKAGGQFVLVANYNKNLKAGGTLTAHLNNGQDFTLANAGISKQLKSSAYTIQAGENVQDLKVESISVQDVQDAKGTHLQTTGNLLNNQYQDIAGDPVTNLANFQIDTAPPVLGATPIAIQQTNGKTSLATPVITLEATDNYNLTKAVFSLNGGTSWCAPIDYAGTINTFDITSSACGGRSTNETKTVTVKFRDAAGNESANAQAQVDYDNSKPQIQTFTTDTATGVYGPGTAIKITATYNENITAGNLVVNLNNGKQVTLDTVENGNQLTTGAKPYVIGSTGSGEDTSKLRVAAIVSQSVSDTADPVNTQEGTSLAGISANLDAGNKTIEIDTIAPVGTVVVDRSKDSNQIQINATDAHDSGMLVQIVPLDDPVAVDSYTKPCNDAVFTSLNDAWSIYADNINTNLIEKSTPDKARKVCARFKDQMGNISSIVEAVTPETPDGVQIDDISNSQISFYGSMLTWQVPALKGTGGTDPFSQYEILKCGPSDSSDCITAYDSTKAERTITDIAKNYYVDTGLISDKYYCYQVRFKDKNGDYSKLPNNTCLQAGHAPAVTDSKVSIVSGHADDVLITDVTESSATVIFQTRDAKYDRPSPSKATITAYTSPTLQEADRAPSTPTPLEADFSVVHTIKLTGLQGGTDYYLKINAIDSWNNPGELLYSPNAIPGLTFKTLGVLTKITDISDPPSVLTDTRAVISFKTDQNAKCLIQYGTSSIANSDAITAYKEVPIGEDDKAEYTNNHSLTLSGLPDTTYYYQITCYDNGKTHTVFSKEYSFKTALKGLTQGDVNAQIGANKTPPVISSVSLANVTGESATITWNTDKSSNSSVIYNPTGATFSRIEGDQLVNTDVTKYVTGHTVTIPGLIPDSKYDFSVMSADASGNITESGISTFTTKAPSSLSSIKVISTALGQATITWSTSSATSSVVEYGLTTTYGQTKQDTSKIKDHTIILDGLTPGQEYHFRVKGEDDLKNIFASSDITFQPKAPPKISDFKIDSIFEHGATVTFVTNVPTDATVTFTDTTKAENSGVQGNPTISTKHEIKLKDLVSGEDFAIKVKVRDEDGNEAEENFQKFTTTKDEVPPKIDRVKTDTALTQNDKVQAIISWTTDEMATGKILYKEGKTGDVKTFDVNTSPSFSHVGVVTSFKPGVVYYFNVVSADVAGNVATSNDFALLTPKQKQNIIQVIIGNFQSIFNWTGNVGK